MKLTDVSKTAIVTLRSHAAETDSSQPLIQDPKAKICLDRLVALAAGDEDQQVFTHQLPKALTSHIAIRARKYDAIINATIQARPGCTVINLGCGFDTRYWRIDHRNCAYIELDLPEVIELKRKILGSEIDYQLIGSSVLDPSWIEQVTQNTNRNFLLVAEGLFMYLPRLEVIDLFKRFANQFDDSRIVLEVVTESYTRGFWKKVVERKMRNGVGVDAGSSYSFGIKSAKDIEDFAAGLKVIDEWSYAEDKDVYPRFLRYMPIRRTQWTVTAAINERK